MKKSNLSLIILTISLIFMINLSYAECISSLDDYAIEVLLNKEDISHNISLLKNAENVNYINGEYLLQSASSPDMAVVIKEVSEPFCKDCISLKIQIPVNRTTKEISYLEFSSTIKNKNMNILQDISDWSYNCLGSSCSFYKNNTIISIDNSVKNISIINVEIIEAPIESYCGGKIIYSSSGAFCIPKQNIDNIESLLKRLKLINNLDEIFLNYKIESSGVKTFYDFSPKLSYTFFPFLSNQNLTKNNKDNLDSIKWDIIMNDEIEWIRFNGILSLNINDMREISQLAKLGYSGVNKRIYYGTDSEGKNRWMYYYESNLPKITKIKNCEDFLDGNIPKDFMAVQQTDNTIKINLYYLIPIVFSFVLIIILIVLIFISRKKISKQLEKERKEITNSK
jgi:hypothetical protein